jgi:hypothetical protein
MALLDDVFGGWTGGVVVGLGAAVFAPSIVPLARSVIRPVAKMLIKGGLAIGEGLGGVVSQTSDSVNGLVAEAMETRRVESAMALTNGQHRSAY